jgi:hypothetical protein
MEDESGVTVRQFGSLKNKIASGSNTVEFSKLLAIGPTDASNI